MALKWCAATCLAAALAQALRHLSHFRINKAPNLTDFVCKSLHLHTQSIEWRRLIKTTNSAPGTTRPALALTPTGNLARITRVSTMANMTDTGWKIQWRRATESAACEQAHLAPTRLAYATAPAPLRCSSDAAVRSCRHNETQTQELPRRCGAA
jgi:hypothetical protein